MLRWLALILVGSIFTAPLGLACEPPPGPAEYTATHATQGQIGTHVITFHCDGDALVVETAIEGEIRVLLLPVLRREGRYREVWRGDRLIAFDSRVVDNGEVYEVTARAEGEKTIIEGRRGRIEAPPDIVSNHPWNHTVIERPLVFDTQRGRLQEVQVTPAGTERITASGRTYSARKYVVSGDLERELWYDEAGHWLQSRLEVRGQTITLTRR
jgi:Family of unknown function (DUF6134)